MKTYQFMLMTIKISFYKVVEAELPCSTATSFPVIDICSTSSVIQDTNQHNVLLKVTSVQECQCQLTIENHNTSFEVQFKRFNDLTSSIPSGLPCGVIVKFAVKGDIFYLAECALNTIIYTVPANNTVDISTVHVNGMLKSNEGYCIEMKKTKNSGQNNRLVLQCYNRSVLTSLTMTSIISEQTSSILIPTSTTSGSFISGSVVQFNETGVKESKVSDSETVLFISAGAAIIGILAVTIVVLVLARRLYYSKKTKQDAPQAEVNVETDVVYDGLHYNILYVPSTNNLQQEHDTTNQRQQMSDTIDVTYSTVDLALPSGSIIENTDKKMSYINTCINDAGSQTKKNTTQEQRKNDIYSIPDKKKIKHISVPGNQACEYAVVDKKLEM